MTARGHPKPGERRLNAKRALAGAAALAALALALPVGVGLLGAVAPAFGYFPAIGGRTLSLEPWTRLLETPGLTHAALVSLLCGLGSAALALAVTLTFLAGARETRLFSWVRRAIAPLLAAPHVAAAFGLAFLIAPSGLLARLVSPWMTGWERPPDLLIINDPWGLALLLGLTLKEIPFLMLMALSAMAQTGAEARLKAARSLGMSPAAAFFKGVFPALYGHLRLPVYAVIAYAASTVEMALILGPSAPPTLAVLTLQLQYDPDITQRYVAAAAALSQLGVAAAAIGLWRLGELAVGRLGRRWLTDGASRAAETAVRLGGAGAMALAAGLSALSLLALALNAVAGRWRFPDALPSAFSLRALETAAPSIAASAANSLIIAGAAVAAALILAIAALENERRRGRPAGPGALAILYLPLVTPQISFLFGLAAAAESLGLRPGLAPVILGHAVFAAPYVYLTLAESYRRQDPRWERAARTLGAGPWGAALRVRAPLLLAPMLTAAAVGFAVSISLYLPTQLLGAGRTPTLATEAVALASAGDRRIVGVWALAQGAPAALAFALAIGAPLILWRNRRGMR